MSDYICPYTCSYRTNSGFCGRTGGAENCQQRRFWGYDSETRQFIVEPVAAGNIVVQSSQTHYDLLIKKTPEEMAKFLTEYRCVHKAPYCKEANCEQCWLDWLKQEAKNN